MNSNRPSAVALHEVTKDFGSVHAVRGIDLTLQPGEVVAFLGPNGAGKTTTIDMILGLSKPTSGTVEVFGMTPRDAVDRGLVAAVMQTGGLLKDLTVAETLRLTASLFTSATEPDEVMRRAGILEIAGRRVGSCSGGQQQRLRFAMALLPDPDLLILDEPTTGMDVTARREFWAAIREGVVDIVASDHAPYTAEEKERGRAAIFDAPSGSAGIETMGPGIFDRALAGDLTLEHAVALLH